MHRGDKEFSLDIIEAYNRIQKYINGIKYDDFQKIENFLQYITLQIVCS
jgi:uncharacterized protein with HEPN domain